MVSGASSVNVTLYNGDTYPATVVGGDSDYDVAVLKIEATGLPAVTLSNSADVNVSDTVMAIGNPPGELTFSMKMCITDRASISTICPRNGWTRRCPGWWRTASTPWAWT